MTIRVGISACLLGEKVRYDGGHKRADFCTEVLSGYFQFVPLCPEVAIGLGVPRPTIRLVQQGSDIRVQSADGALDVTEPLKAYGLKKSAELTDLSGYIFCAKSPSCGMERVPLLVMVVAARVAWGSTPIP